MDVILDIADQYCLDGVYSSLPYLHTLARDNIIRQFISLNVITDIFAYILYFTFASMSYYFLYDKELMNHPKFIKNQASFFERTCVRLKRSLTAVPHCRFEKKSPFRCWAFPSPAC
jgi:hypothetical protein